MSRERHTSALAAAGLVVTLFLPWYQETVIATMGRTSLQSSSASLTGWGAFSFVEAAVLVVAVAVLTLLFQRAEGRPFRLPGGDGGAISALGAWTCLLVVWRMFDKQGSTSHGQYVTTYGIEWGIFVTLGAALLLTWAGRRVRSSEGGADPPAATAQPPDPHRRTDPRGAAWAGAEWPLPQRGAGAEGPLPQRGAGAEGPLPQRATAAPAPPRRRRTATPVDPVDPPEMPAVRRSRATQRDPAAVPPSERPTRALADSAADPPPNAPEEQLTIPFDEHRP